MWAFGADDIWLGTYAGQLVHYDGQSWEEFATGSGDTTGSGIVKLWGSSDGQLFFMTFSEVGRWNGAEVELLIAPPEGSDRSNLRFGVRGLWGLSSSEVFVAVEDGAYGDYQCGAQFLLWFDGEEFHPF